MLIYVLLFSYCEPPSIFIHSCDSSYQLNKYIIFVEVKTRSGVEFGQPSEAVNKIKQRHMRRAAQYYLYKSKLLNSFVRFDVAEVLMNNGKFNVNHIKQIM